MLANKIIQKTTKVLLSMLPETPEPETHKSLSILKDIKPSLSKDAANRQISELFLANSGCMIARFGSVELGALLQYERYCSFNRLENVLEYATSGTFPFSKGSFSSLRNNAGFFPINRNSVSSFFQEMIEAMKEVDVLGSWVTGESRFENELSSAALCSLSDLEPYYHEAPWSAKLEGKKVLVIHPFAETITKQYELKRELLFPGKNVLPKFDLSCLKSVQSIAGNGCEHKSWQSALDWMTSEALNLEFDVAIIGCGAYGFPLAARLKRIANKKSIHLGGATQILFGIRGSRWDSHPIISKLYNENWVRPLDAERPTNADSIEGACYW